MNSASSNSWTLPILSAVVILLATVLIGPLHSLTGESSGEKVPSTTPRAEVTPAHTASLFLSPNTLTLDKNKEATVSVVVSSTGELTGVELHLTYDPKVLTVSQISPGDFFQNPSVLFEKIDSQKGEAVYTLGTLTPLSGKGTVARIKVAAKALGSSGTISLKGSQAAASGESGNVIQSIGDLNILIK